MNIIKRIISSPLLIVFGLGIGSAVYTQGQKNNSAATFLQSQTAIVRLGVWNKFGDQKEYTAIFVVTASNGKQSKSQKNVSANEGWVYTDFPNEFTGDVPNYSIYATYNWTCLVGSKVIANGQFQWGNSRAGVETSVAGKIDENTPNRDSLKRRTEISWKDMPLIKGKAVSRPDTIVFGKSYPDSIYTPDEIVGFRTEKKYRKLVMLVGIQDNPEARGGKHFQIKDENGVLFEDEVLPNRRPKTIEIDISESDVVGFTNYEINGEPKEFFRYINIYFIPK